MYNNKIYVGLGINDNNSYIVKLSVDEIKNLFHNLKHSIYTMFYEKLNT